MINLIDVDKYEIDEVKEFVNISTMCTSCKLNTKVNIDIIFNELKLDPDNILSIKVINKDIQTLLDIPKSKQKRNTVHKEKKNYFYNQLTLVMRINTGTYTLLNTEPKINIKLFKNGSIQMSGCKNVSGVNVVLNKLINILNSMKSSLSEDDNEIIFYDRLRTPVIISDFKIDMINSNYKIDMVIDRRKLAQLLITKKIKSVYETCTRACVIIKFTPTAENPLNKDVSIFIFQKGNIIITGSKSKHHIIESYNYITDILLTHRTEICKTSETDNKFTNILAIYDLIVSSPR